MNDVAHLKKTLSVVLTLAAAGSAVWAMLLMTAPTAEALPLFARQTGQPCGNCHTDVLGLTPFGRRFKLGGYTLGGGPFRKTLFPIPPSGKVFPSVSDFNSVLSPGSAPKDAVAELRSYAETTSRAADPARKPPQGSAQQVITNSFAAVQPEAEEDRGWMPPLAVMLISGYTRTQAPDSGWAPGVNHWKANDNIGMAQASLFGGGAMSDNIGVFAQLTYGFPAIGDATGTWGWDNVDVRYAGTGQVGGVDVLFGITAHNNPTVQDVWNTAPAWTHPYFTTQLGFTGPATTTIIDGQYGQKVGGLGGYLFINDMLYLEATGYKTLGVAAATRLGAGPLGSPGQIAGVAPYGRAALEQRFGDHNLMIGGFASRFEVAPWSVAGVPVPLDVTGNIADTPYALTNKYTDFGVDTQYQYRGDDYWVIFKAAYIREEQRYDAGYVGASTPVNLTNSLNTLRVSSTVAIGGDNRVVATGQYFRTWGSPDAGLYGPTPVDPNWGTVPDTTGFMAELAYLPFGTGKAPYWPWFNTRIGAQYFYFTKFNGDTLTPHDKNTFILYSTILF
ncbi:MAG: cytochrome C [Rhodopseudomonas palustris]|uniref:Cytochrome C n=1 Tax=Rhodopseudomonas palustris TaxID=1076 RepID=A0A933S2E8_RHOPL|nr:cytochrome C [Rhodopseudomonas palustris]